jgi:uncharacterized protein
MHHPKFLVKKSGTRFHFHLTASNGEIILTGQRYTRPASAGDGVASVKTNAPLDKRYERRWARNGQRYFVLKAANGEVIGTSEMYASNGGMERGIESVKRNAPRAGGGDVSTCYPLATITRPRYPRAFRRSGATAC